MATRYYASTAGLNEATIRKYIQEQEKRNQTEDKMMKKEYTFLFKGQLGIKDIEA